MPAASSSTPRLLPDRKLPPYAYLPGRQPHPVRHPLGHSYRVEPLVDVTVGATLSSDAYRWGIDLFNRGYYWEAHEAWETLWMASGQSTAHRLFFKALILLAAAGVKIREGKSTPAARHSGRAASLFRTVARLPDEGFEEAIGMSLDALAHCTDASATSATIPRSTAGDLPEHVFDFLLSPDTERA